MKKLAILIILILQGVCTFNYAQTIQIIDSNSVSIDLNELNFINTTLSKKIHYANLLRQKDYQIQMLDNTIAKLDSVLQYKDIQIDDIKKENEELQPTLLDQIKKYGFFIGLAIGVLLGK